LHKGFGISNTSLLPYYIICIGQWLIQNDHLLTVMLCLRSPLCQHTFLAHMVILWMTWTRCMTDTLGAQQK
jgi:hypothetical protein